MFYDSFKDFLFQPLFSSTITPFFVLEVIIGLSAIILTMLAYKQTNRRKFIYINIAAVIAFGISVSLKGGFIGGLSTLVAVFLYSSALILPQEKQRKIQFLAPILIFIFYLVITDKPTHPLPFLMQFPELIALLIPFGSAITTFAIYQDDMIKQKKIFLIGLIFWALYSLAIQAYFAMVTDLLGFFVMFHTLRSMIKDRESAERRSLIS